MPIDSEELMKICKEGLPETTDEYVPDLVHDFIYDYRNEILKIIEV